MSVLNALRCSYGALRALAGISGFINLFCPRFDRKKNAAVRSQAALPDGLLNGQGLGALAALPYGAWNMGSNGCEVIAVYNALQALGRPAPFTELADALERRGLLFNGYGGTNLSAAAACLRAHGVDVAVLRRRDRARFDAALAASGCAILSYWTGPTLRRADGSWNMLHTVAVLHGADGVEVCNFANDSPEPCRCASLEAFLRREGGEPVCLFALDRRPDPAR